MLASTPSSTTSARTATTSSRSPTYISCAGTQLVWRRNFAIRNFATKNYFRILRKKWSYYFAKHCQFGGLDPKACYTHYVACNRTTTKNHHENAVCEISQHLFAKFPGISRNYCYEISRNKF
jgi:hypothetical protein